MCQGACKKPPLGLTPRYIYQEQQQAARLEMVQAAIAGYSDAALPIPIEWVQEYNELVGAKKPSNELFTVGNIGYWPLPLTDEERDAILMKLPTVPRTPCFNAREYREALSSQ